MQEERVIEMIECPVTQVEIKAGRQAGRKAGRQGGREAGRGGGGEK